MCEGVIYIVQCNGPDIIILLYFILTEAQVQQQHLPTVRIVLNMQQLFYGMTYLMILEKFPILISLRIF